MPWAELAGPFRAARQDSLQCGLDLGQAFSGVAFGQVHCLDLATGELIWRGGSFGRESSCLVTADDKLLVLGNGNLGLIDASAEQDSYRELASVKGVIGGTCYPHLALADGILAVKNKEGNLICLSVRPR